MSKFANNIYYQILKLNARRNSSWLCCTWICWVVFELFRHIPHRVYSDFVPIEKEKPRYEIPGYAGYISSIRPENLHAKTFGKLTYDISDGNFLKGQDHLPEDKYISCQTDTHISPSEMLQRTAADIVGVDNKKI